MSYAAEMKNLVSDIKASTKDRLQFVSNVKADTHKMLKDLQETIGNIVKDTHQLIAQFVKAGKERQEDLSKLLAEFDKAMKEIQARVKDIARETKQLIARFTKESGERADDTKDLLAEYDKTLKIMAKELKDFLATSEDTRLADFDATMKDVQGQVKVVVKDAHEVIEQNFKDIQAIQKDVKDLLDEYAGERKEATHAWQPIRKKWAEVGVEAGVEAPAPTVTPHKKRGRKSEK